MNAAELQARKRKGATGDQGEGPAPAGWASEPARTSLGFQDPASGRRSAPRLAKTEPLPRQQRSLRGTRAKGDVKGETGRGLRTVCAGVRGAVSLRGACRGRPRGSRGGDGAVDPNSGTRSSTAPHTSRVSRQRETEGGEGPHRHAHTRARAATV